ncbi:MAG: Ig-like domain-containing protein [Tannerellaceae bacterium]|jgi:uncharacterized protein YjdB|nr:Ig-like domain-containing protein [Tannerellaceae bacterium]
MNMNKNLFMLFLYCFLAVGNLCAGAVLKVTRVDGNDTANNPGSFRYELEHMADGDTLVFDDALATETITIGSNLTIGNASLPTTGKSFTIIGNGVTLTSGAGTYTLNLGARTTAPAKITVENVVFKDYYIVHFAGQVNRIVNCCFTSTAQATRQMMVRLDGCEQTSFEGCAFSSENNHLTNTLSVTSAGAATAVTQAKKVDFVSCTFVRQYAGRYPLVYWANMDAANTKSFVNCVLMDKAVAATVPLVRIPETNFLSRGYNVISGQVNDVWQIVPDWKQLTDIYVKASGATHILTEQASAQLVAVSGGNGLAYRHLPAHPEAIQGLEAVRFPERDLDGALIDYSGLTHSGAWQRTDGSDVSLETMPTDLLILSDSATLFSETTLRLGAIVSPVRFDQRIAWSSSDESIATVDADGLVTAQATASTENRTVRITATSVAHAVLSQSIELTVKPYTHIEEVHLDADQLSVSLNHSVQLTASYLPLAVNNPALTWTILPEGIATMTVAGQKATLKGLAEGQATVTVSSVDGNKVATCIVDVFKRTTHVVTNALTDDKTEGSFLFELHQMADGDTLTFDASLTKSTIPIKLDYWSTSYAFLPAQQNMSFTIIGNGVTLPSFQWTLSSGIIRKLTLENLRLQMSENFKTSAETLHLKNCIFDNTSSKAYCLTFDENRTNPNIEHTIEGCAFLGTNAACYISTRANIAFVSCSFVRGMSSGSTSHLHVISAKVTMANCVIMDQSNPTENSPSIYLQTASSILTSKGANVIQGYIQGNAPQWHAMDTVLSLTDEKPLVQADGIWKVHVGTVGTPGTAYRRLPAQPEGLQDFAGMSFPKRDLAGNLIDYNAPAHSGAWQVIDGQDLPYESLASSMYIASGSLEMFSETTLPLSATILPTTVNQAVVWSSSDETIATVDAQGIVSAKATNGTEDRTVDITAVSLALNVNSQSLSQTITITVKPYVHVENVSLDTTELSIYRNYATQLTATLSPANINDSSIIWSAAPEGIVQLAPDGRTVEIRALEVGEAVVTAISPDGNHTAVCRVVVTSADYSKGVFVVNEDWFGHAPGSLNFFTKQNEWVYNVVKNENPGHTLGITSPFGVIYGDKFYITSKQDAGGTASRLAVLNAKTLKLEKEFKTISTAANGTSTGDGRSFLGVDEQKGYVSTSNGIHVLDIDRMTLSATAIAGSESTSPTNLYSAQVGNMQRVGNRVFAVHQLKGLLVIDANSDVLQTTIAAPTVNSKACSYASIAQSKDGDLWLGVVSQDFLVRVDPWTLDTMHVALPSGWGVASSWAAWTPDPYCAGIDENVLYWAPRQGGAFLTTATIIRYEIDRMEGEVIFDGKTYDDGKWTIYSGGFRVDPVSGNLYVLLGHTGASSVYGSYNLGILNPKTRDIVLYPMSEWLWFPSMPVFPDNESPELAAHFPSRITLWEKHPTDSLYLGDLASDMDNANIGIIKTIDDNYDRTLIKAQIWRDSLIVVALKPVPAGAPAEETTLTIRFNSNGKLVTRSIPVIIEGGTPSVTINPFELTQHSLSLIAGQTGQLSLTAPQHFRVNWRSTDPSIASVDSHSGLVTAFAAGTTLIIVDDIEQGQSDTCTVTVTQQAGEATAFIRLNKTYIWMAQGERTTLQITTSSSLANRTVTWTASNPSVADVTPSGSIIAITNGTCEVRATIGDYSAACFVSVGGWPDKVMIDQITEQNVRLLFPQIEGASYYLVHIYRETNDGRTPVRTYKVMSDGAISLLRGLMGNHLIVPIGDLTSGTHYNIVIESLRESKGNVETIHTEDASFLTLGSSPTGVENGLYGDLSNANVWYAGGMIHLLNLSGYDCSLYSSTGQKIQIYSIRMQDESHPIILPRGVYLLSAEKDGLRKMIRFIVGNRY